MTELKNGEATLWTPLVGFDRDLPGHGAEEYLEKVGFRPSAISLFVFNADIINLHPGMDKEFPFPQDYCNYYGSLRNELRTIQPWTNYDLRELAAELKKSGVDTYMGIMGNHTPDQTTWFGQSSTQKFLLQHPELIMQGYGGTNNLYALKRFADGSYFEDYFVEMARKTLNDYGIGGVHMSDGFCPPNSTLNSGDFSDDMIGQFMDMTGISLPNEVAAPLNDPASAGLEGRTQYIWYHYRAEWIRFIGRRWEQFFTKLCRTLHADGKKVMVNNSWTSEPFEAIYRYGIDYKGLERAGVDVICVEDQATAVHSCDAPGAAYRIHEYMQTPMITKAYAPDVKILSINFAKDSTEELSILNHIPCANEREIHTLASKLYYGADGVRRASEGFFICLADALHEKEWDVLREEYEAVFEETQERSLSPVLVWSDSFMDSFLPEYIDTRRWSAHKFVAELSKHGGKIGGVVRIENLKQITGPIFVPLADLLPQEEVQMLSEYQGGPVIYGSLTAKKFQIPGKTPDIYFEDPGVEREDWRMCIGAAGVGYLDYANVTLPLAGAQVQEQLTGEGRYIPDPNVWLVDLLFREASEGFVEACARLVRAVTRAPGCSDLTEQVTVYRMKDGRVRYIAENDSFSQYKDIVIHTKEAIAEIHNTSNFPAQPLKLVLPDGSMAVDCSPDGRLLCQAKGFVMKIPPAGVSVVDVIYKTGI